MIQLKNLLNKIILNPGDDDLQLFCDARSGQLFRSTLFQVQQAEYFINRDLTMRDYVYLNEWYEHLGIDIVEDGYKLGWSVGMCLECYWQNWIDFDHRREVTDDGQEYILISFWEEPMEGFEEYS